MLGPPARRVLSHATEQGALATVMTWGNPDRVPPSPLLRHEERVDARGARVSHSHLTWLTRLSQNVNVYIGAMRDSRLPSETRRPRPRSGRRQTDARSATIREVARAAGVSVATVSRVLNGKGPVREDTTRTVRAAADRLRYVPHGGARSLITRRTNAIGVLLPDLFGEFFSEAIRGIDRAARPAGYQLLVSGSHGDRSQAEAALRAMRGRVDGLVVMSPNVDGPTLERESARGLARHAPELRAWTGRRSIRSTSTTKAAPPRW